MNSHPTQIRAEMVGNVLAISVSVGEVIATGDVLLLLESMKMEIPVLSEIPGTVVEIAVAPLRRLVLGAWMWGYFWLTRRCQPYSMRAINEIRHRFLQCICTRAHISVARRHLRQFCAHH